MKKYSLAQHISFGIAIASYLAGIVCLVIATINPTNLDFGKAVYSSLLASTVFFFGMGIVLHVIGRSDLPSLKIRTEDSE